MRYVSTNSQSAPVGLCEAINRCVATDGGLFMPAELPRIPKAFFNNIGDMSFCDIAYVVANSFFGQDVDSAALKDIVDKSFSFDTPMIVLDDNYFILELFHGPTLTFKDYGARFMARLMKYIDGRQSLCRNVLVATTGNTGAAAANGLFNIEGISVSVLYPKGQLSRWQTAQLTALGKNIHPIEVVGTVEDCKRLVQSAIADPALSGYHLTGANSINIARLIPQITITLYAYARLKTLGVDHAEQALYAMPTGNISNLVAAAMAKRLGCPTGPIVGATAANNQLAPLLAGGEGHRTKPIRTLAPSIDMTYPSGWPRLLYLYDGKLDAMRRDIVAPEGISDQVIEKTVTGLRDRYGYTIDTHGAVAYAAAASVNNGSAPKVIFATGHPAKQLDIITRIIGASVDMPHQLARFMSVKRTPTIIPPTLPALKKHLDTILTFNTGQNYGK